MLTMNSEILVFKMLKVIVFCFFLFCLLLCSKSGNILNTCQILSIQKYSLNVGMKCVSSFLATG